MYTDVAFKYDCEIKYAYIYSIFVVADLGVFGDVHYVVMGLARNYHNPVIIGALGSFTDINSAFRRVEEIAKNYPPVKSIPDEIINCLDNDIENYVCEQYPPGAFFILF